MSSRTIVNAGLSAESFNRLWLAPLLLQEQNAFVEWSQQCMEAARQVEEFERLRELRVQGMKRVALDTQDLRNSGQTSYPQQTKPDTQNC